MRITKVKLDNYVCFYQTPEFELGPGINFVVGKNNAGKTALLDALSHTGVGEPHRSIDMVTRNELSGTYLNSTKFEISYRLDMSAVLGLMSQESTEVYIPSRRVDKRHNDLVFWDASYGTIRSDSGVIIFDYASNEPVAVRFPQIERPLSLISEDELECWPEQIYSEKGRYRLTSTTGHPDKRFVSKRRSDTCWSAVANLIPKFTFRIVAERPVRSRGTQVRNSVLHSDASNLPQVLRTLEGSDRYLFQELVRMFRAIFVEVQDIRLASEENGEASILLDFVEPSKRRPDLGVPMNKCGAGVGQILAMLYVVVTSEEPRVIIIDEPNSFLHPGAVRKLLEIFQLPEYSHHQYIIATHSPTAIASVREKTILLVTRENMVSSVKTIDQAANADLEWMLSEVGVRISDVFGMDSIIWVEGRTEEICFPLILRSAGVQQMGCKILRVDTTGAFTHKTHGPMAMRIYKKLSESGGILPPALGFVFDGDMKQKVEKLRGEFGKLLQLLSRQNYESYLLDYPDIIAEELGISEARVRSWIDKNNSKAEYGAQAADFEEGGDWLQTINGAKFIAALFCCLGAEDCRYDKVRHGEALTRRILEKHPDHFSEIVGLIQGMMKQAN